jgi:hypothetical protein
MTRDFPRSFAGSNSLVALATLLTPTMPKSSTAAAGTTDLPSAAPQDRGSVAAVDTACFQSQCN